jgi:hypothetical protein
MNERIKELAEQCRWQEIVIEDGEEWIHVHFLEQKFAELLIEECARICDVVRENNGGDRQFGARLCADEIRYLNRRS